MTLHARIVTRASIIFLFLLGALTDPAMAGKAGHGGPGKTCPYKEVKPVDGSKILFEEDVVDFGQLPYARKVTHLFRFKNVGSAPLLLAPHVTSKVIEGC